MYKEQQQEQKSKVFGLAEDYYRVRMLTVGEELPADLEWRDDVHYESPKAYPSKLKTTYRIQVLDYTKMVFEIANLRDKREAKRRLKALQEDLQELTKMKFDEKYGIEDLGTDDVSVISKRDEKLGNSIFFTGVNKKPEN